jgi:hypothetical protein
VVVEATGDADDGDGLVVLDGLVVRWHRSSSRRTASDERPIQIDRALAGSNSAIARSCAK